MEDMQGKGVPANTTYIVAISAWGNGYQWQRSLHRMEGMQSKGVSADTMTYIAIISACEEG